MAKTVTYTWLQLNRVLKNTASDKVVLRIFEQQRTLPTDSWKAKEQRERWLARIWSRYARLRARRERKEIVRR